MLIVCVLTGVITGTATGLVVAAHFLDRFTSTDPPDAPTMAPRKNDTDRVAQEWAEATGRPGFGPVLAEKLRTADSIMRRRERRRGSGRTSWFR